MREKGLSCVPKCEYRFPVNGISQMNAEWTGLEFAKSQRVVEKREKWRETGCETICGAPKTLVVKGSMMMMMIMMMVMR